MNRDLVAAAAAARELVSRRKADPLYTWEPYSGSGGAQRGFLGSDAPEAWFVGANRCGKSDALAALVGSMARFGHPDPKPCYLPGGLVVTDRATSIWVVSLTFPLSRDIIQAKIFDNGYVPPGQPHGPFIPKSEIPKGGWNVSNSILRLKNGSIIGFKSCDQGRELFQGTGKDLVAFDEAPDHSVYIESTLRVEAGRRLFIRGACTLLPPDGIVGGVSWLYTEKIQPWKARTSKNLEVFTASIYENPYLLRSEIERLEALYPVGSIDRRIRLEGELLPSIAGARAYSAFTRTIHVNPALTPRLLDFRLPLLWALDFNVEPMISTVWQLHGRLYRGFDEIVIPTDASPMEMAEQFRRRYPAHGAEIQIYGDASGNSRGQTGKSNYALLVKGLEGASHTLRLFIPDKNPHITDRVNAVNSLLRGVNGEVRVELSPTMTETITDLEGVLLDTKGGIKKTSNKSDPYFRRTHASDGMGYLMAYREPVSMARSTTRKSITVRQPGYSFTNPIRNGHPGFPGYR